VLAAVVLVDRERRVAGDVFFKKGHTARDWRRRVSIADICVLGCNWIVGIFFEGLRVELRGYIK
jgi:hypothetical protein